MNKKAPELTAGLVAIKGAGVPASDMPARAAGAAVSALAAPEPPKTARGKGEALTPLNFRISASFRREFKTYAATHDLKLNELLRRCFEAYRRQAGD